MNQKTSSMVIVRSVTPDKILGEIVGTRPVPRIEITRRLWSYIKMNNLQDQNQRTIIRADRRLKALFGGKSTMDQYAMEKCVSKHVS